VLSVGPPKDGIPSLDDPVFVSIDEAGQWLGGQESVLILKWEGKIRIYPLQIPIWHEIVNDSVNVRSVAVTYCPLCNTGIAFKSEIDGQSLQFGTTGRLRYSNIIMYDRQSES